MSLESCEMDVRTGGTYRLVFKLDTQSMAFFGRYLEVIPHSRIVWTNEEGGERDATITTVGFEAAGTTTLVTVHEVFPSKVAADEALDSGASGALPVQLDQLDRFIRRSTVF